MDSDTFWTGVLKAFQSSPDGIKALWLLVPPMFVLAVAGLAMRYRLAIQQVKLWDGGELIYTIVRDHEGRMLVHRHGGTPLRDETLPPIDMAADRAWLEGPVQTDPSGRDG